MLILFSRKLTSNKVGYKSKSNVTLFEIYNGALHHCLVKLSYMICVQRFHVPGQNQGTHFTIGVIFKRNIPLNYSGH